MLGIELAVLSAPEVKRLLELARARGQHTLARQLEAELAARPGRTAGHPLPMSAMPRSAPLSAPRRAVPPPVRRRRGPAALVAGLAAFVGGAVAWGLSLNPQPPAPSAALDTASPAPRIAVALTHTALPEEALTQPAEEPAAPALVAELPREPSSNPCLDLPTAHERLVCGYPSVAILDRRMKAALERARAASGSDARAIEAAQADWQEGSTNIQDRHVLGERYARRIAELESQ